MAKNRTYTNRRYLDALEQSVLIFDGAMGTSLQTMNLTAEDFGGRRYEGCNDYLCVIKPEAVREVHHTFLEAGADVVETNTFRANRITLADFELADQVYEINFAAASLARAEADQFSTDDRPRFVAGSMGPSGKLPSANDPDLSDVTFEELQDVFREQAVPLIEGGVDLLLIETSQDLMEVKAAIAGVQRAFEDTGRRIPLQAQVTLDTSGRMLFGTDIATALTAIERLPIDVFGLNCSTGPEHMRDPIRYLGEHASLPISCIPNAGLPLNVDGQAVYPLKPEAFTSDLQEFVKAHGVGIVGGCCGTTPDHIRLLANAIHGHDSPERPEMGEPRLASAFQSIPMHQEPRPLLVGERINTQGSRMAKRFLMEGDLDGIVELARSQVDKGAHALDICVALTEQSGEDERMQEVVHKLSMSVEAPLVIDTTEVEVMEAALEVSPGRCILNSINLESGHEKAERVIELAERYGAAVMALTIDKDGMAKTVDRKLEIARRIHALATQEHDLLPEDLIFDPLTFTLATGDEDYVDSANETLEAIRRIKNELPGVMISLGVSNISFGLNNRARQVINSVMLYHAVQAGLDMAIVNPAHITPYAEIPEAERVLAEDLLFNRHSDALQQVIEHFEKGSDKDSVNGVEQDPTKGMSAEERIYWRILHRHKEGVRSDIDEILQQYPEHLRSQGAVIVLNDVLLPAMKEVGDRFGAGKLILPFVLQSAEVMKIAVAHLEQFLDKQDGVGKGVIVLATVYGDVHDIGKNLVKTILSNNGYTVHDMGKQVPANVIIDKSVEMNADAIGLSALLVSTSKQMPLIVNELHRRGRQIPVLIGGAAINRRFGRRITFTEDGEPYAGGVFYCKDAFEGLSVLDQLQEATTREQLLQDHLTEAAREKGKIEVEKVVTVGRSEQTTVTIPQPPYWGSRVVEQMPLDSVFHLIDRKELFRLSWGAKNTHGNAWEQLQEEFEERLERMKKEALHEGWLKAQGVYGFWPALSDGNDLVIYDPRVIETGRRDELMRFEFPRQASGERLCLADYFAHVDSDLFDVVAFQVVTVGSEASEKVERLQEEGDYAESYFEHGLAVQTAEAAAEFLHRHIRRELSLGEDQGKRYSWGYPSIPQLQDHEKVFSLLPAESALDMSLSPAWQLIPEQSTAAIILHHPESKYFSIGVSRVEQLMASGED
ncbi:MAG: methionine synthase [Anaerolineales bacterium]|nr:methionine synthase [Anaerolineales bacterium]